jgi:rhamnosyltransferase
LKRLTIYAFYDPDGLVDDYVIDCVTAVAEYSERVIFVSNGEVDRDSVRPIGDLPNVEVIERVNEGLDIWGYKHGLDLVGWSHLEDYGEVVMMNSTIAGPLYPLSEMFDAMDASDVDFWGITAHAGEDYDPWNLLPTGRIERHIQSYFMAVRIRMLQSSEFRSYWETLVPLGSYTDAVARHEAIFTHKFTELGFRWTTYVDGTDLECLSPYPLMFMPEQVLIGKRCPFFKRKALFLATEDLVATHATSTTTMVDCLHRLGYDLQRVLPNVIRTNHQSDIRIALNAFELLTPRRNEDAGDLPDVRVIAWVTDIADCIALELHRPTLERCTEFVVATAHEAGSQVAERLGQFEARAIIGATFAAFVREVGRASRTEGHVLLFGAHREHDPDIGTYVRSETGLRALAGDASTLASATARLTDSSLTGALTSPLLAHTIAVEAASWHRVSARTERLLMGIGIQVPIHPEKPACGPPSGVVLAGPGMLAADWDLAADIMDHLDESTAAELFVSMIPFIVQSHGRLLAFALPEALTGMAIFSGQIQAFHAPGVRTLQSRVRGRALREYRKLRHRLLNRARIATR